MKIINLVLLSSVILTGCQGKSFFNLNEGESDSQRIEIQTNSNKDIKSNINEGINKQINKESPGGRLINSIEIERLEKCKKMLDSIKKINPNKYVGLKKDFSNIMQGAANYASVRAVTSHETQETIDALYYYRSNLICSQIGQTMLDSLSLTGDLP